VDPELLRLINESPHLFREFTEECTQCVNLISLSAHL
jgi:hypothetical protein